MARIVVIDDDEDDRMLLQLAFEQVLPQTTVCYLTGGAEAITYLTDCSPPPELLITDLNMPSINGSELITLIRASGLYASLPIVVISTSTESDDRTRCYGAGANAFLPKSASMHDVTNLIRLIGQVWLGEK